MTRTGYDEYNLNIKIELINTQPRKYIGLLWII